MSLLQLIQGLGLGLKAQHVDLIGLFEVTRLLTVAGPGTIELCHFRANSSVVQPLVYFQRVGETVNLISISRDYLVILIKQFGQACANLPLDYEVILITISNRLFFFFILLKNLHKICFHTLKKPLWSTAA